MSAAVDTLDVALEPIGGRGPRRIAVLLGAAVFVALSVVLQDLTLPATTRVVVRRRADGAVVARGTVDRALVLSLYERMRAALEREDEGAFLERWGDPTTWEALAS